MKYSKAKYSKANVRGRLKSTTYFVAITQTSFQRTSSTPPFGLSLNASYLALFKRPLTRYRQYCENSKTIKSTVEVYEV